MDTELVRRGLVDSRAEAQQAIAAGLVTVDGAPALKPATEVHVGQAVTVAVAPRRYVSRGGDKLAAGLTRYRVDPTGRQCLDAGTSTGGFTDCLLQHGAAHVIAVDVGYGQLHERLRRDPRVTVLERMNVRDLVPGDLPYLADLLVADLSFISLTRVLPALRRVATPDAEAVVLVKPQFEAGRDQVGRGGVVRDPEVWRAAIQAVAASAAQLGWSTGGVAPSPLVGPAGNVEFLLQLTPGPAVADLAARVDAAVAEAGRIEGGGR